MTPAAPSPCGWRTCPSPRAATASSCSRCTRRAPGSWTTSSRAASTRSSPTCRSSRAPRSRASCSRPRRAGRCGPATAWRRRRPFGGFAEVALAPAFITLPIPDDQPFDVAAAMVINYQTAHLGLIRRGRLQPGEAVLVHGAAGGVGTAAIQVAKAAGAGTVIALGSSDERRRVADAGRRRRRARPRGRLGRRGARGDRRARRGHRRGPGRRRALRPQPALHRARGPHPRDRVRERDDPDAARQQGRCCAASTSSA